MRLSPGDLVEVTWLDAMVVSELDEFVDGELQRGGSELHIVGFLLQLDKKMVLIVEELDSNRKPFRGFNLIPRGIVKNIRLIERGSKWKK